MNHLLIQVQKVERKCVVMGITALNKVRLATFPLLDINVEELVSGTTRKGMGKIG